jgi:transcriptional regulator GlxA family with amidase domain
VTRARWRVAICLWNDAELLDFAGPAEVFAATDDGAAFRVYTVGETRDPVTCQGFLHIIPEYDVLTCPQPDIIVLPGGGSELPLNRKLLRNWILSAAAGADIVLSVCTGALVLASLGLLDGLEATTWYGAIDRLRQAAPATAVYGDRRFVDNGHIVTSAGVSAGIDAALHVVARLCGHATAVATARYMEYDWSTGHALSVPAPPTP